MIKIKDFFSNREELAIGAVFGLAPVYFIGWRIILTMLICAVAWRLGGVTGGDRWFRRLGVPGTQVIAIFIATHNPLAFAPFAAMWGPLSLGYGIPSPGDTGSKIGAFWYYHTGEIEVMANLLTRITIAAICIICLIPLFFISVLGGLIASAIILVGFPLATILI